MTAPLLGAFGLASTALLVKWRADHPDLHIILDTSAAVLAAGLALLLWDMSRHARSDFPKQLSVAFAATGLLWLVHDLVIVAFITDAKYEMWQATSPPAEHLLPIALALALWRKRWGARGVVAYGVVVFAVGAALLLLFQKTPTYLPPGLLGVTRQTSILAPLFWAAVGFTAWRMRDSDRLMRPIAWMAVPLFLGDLVMLHSRAPADGPSIVAHLGTVCGYLILTLFVMRMAAQDLRQRIFGEAALAQANEGLERRVLERTAELATTNASLQQEIAERHRAEARVNAQLERLVLLHQITRAIGERQDLDSIFQVVVRSVEKQLPADFACLCLYDELTRKLTVGAVGINSQPLAFKLAMPERAVVDIDQNGLSHCVKGNLVYEPDIADVDFPFPRRLAGGGLRALVAVPLQVESRVFGVLVVARFAPESFTSGECEFLHQLSEHAALAAHQAQLYRALQDAYDDLRQSQQSVVQHERLRALGQMASGIAHDINNTLSPVALYTETMLETEADMSAPARRHLGIIQRAVEDVTQTISRMREFYRERGPQLDLAPVRLNELVRQVVDLTQARWKDMAGQRGVVVDMRPRLDDALPAVMGVESEIRDALVNLIFNAVDAMPDGGALTVRTRTRGAAGGTEPVRVEVEVEDDGVGMDAETLGRCLEPFFTTKGERGSGLGLAMVYGVAERHGAAIDVRSEPGQGTTVSLSFPAADGAGAAVQHLEEWTPLKRLRLLLVDDDPVLLRALRDALETDGHMLVVANDGQAGIDAFRAAIQRGETFDAVFTDLGMPYVDGRKVAAAVKAASPSTPVILLTGWGKGLNGEAPAHVDQVLGKPPRLRELRRALVLQCQDKARRP